MELSTEDKLMLKNYASINPNIAFKEGNKISTISEAKNIISTCTLSTNIPQDVGIYDLNELLNVLDLAGNEGVTIDFNDTHLMITEKVGLRKIKYFYTSMDMLTMPTEKMINNAHNMEGFEVSFILTERALSDIRKAASVLGHTSLSITPGDDGIITLSVLDIDNPTSNVFSMDVSGKSEDDFNFVINISNIKVVPGDYEVRVSTRQVSHFKNTKHPIEYWIALEKTS